MILFPPHRLPSPPSLSVFLAGTIDMGNSIDWQSEIGEAILMAFPDVVIFNPRRANWDSSWEQTIDNPVFLEQVVWELDHLKNSNLALFNFEERSLSPITLMELGNRLESSRFNSEQHNLVYCPELFWRKGNVDIICDRYEVSVFTNKDKFKEAALKYLEEQKLRIEFSNYN